MIKEWQRLANDAFRVVEQHKKNGILYWPCIPHVKYQQGAKTCQPPKGVVFPKVDYPIALETVNQLLQMNLYETFEDFKRDMLQVFRNSETYLKNCPKLLKDCQEIKLRFLKYI